jgi:hypothetical protein
MPLPLFRKTVVKAKAEGFPNIALINWTEPFLCTNLHQYVTIVKELDLDCWLSSNLSLPPDKYLETMKAALRAGVDILFVSVSGFTQEIYQINHKAGRVDWIKQNVAELAKMFTSREIGTGIWIRYLQWPYNAHEKKLWADYAEELGIGFEPISAHGDPKTPLPNAVAFRKEVDFRLRRPTIKSDFDPLFPNVIPASQTTNAGSISDNNARTKGTNQANYALSKELCPLILDRIALDAKGDMYLCCAYPNEPRLKIGHYTALSEREHFMKRVEHDFCKTCAFPQRAVTEKDLEKIEGYFRDPDCTGAGFERLTPETAG